MTAFAFPYGEPGVAFGPEHTRAATQAGYQTILTMQPGFVDSTEPSNQCPRIGVGGDIADAVLAEIARVHRVSNGWPTVAPDSGDVLKQRVRRVSSLLFSGLS